MKNKKTNIAACRKHLSNEAFMFDVKKGIIKVTSQKNDLEFEQFKAALNEAIKRHAPVKKLYVRANRPPFMNKKVKQRNHYEVRSQK